ncbi:MAG: 50S ribosomal protein L15 [Bacteroidia bacterium]|nr:50S ribosomal protein L15 [Bacteroidia bacterium]
MKLHTLQPAKGSVKQNYRKGRGEGSGNGDTAGRGHKGNQSRSGYKRKKGFEGGQMPLQRRIPKFGFKNFNRTEYTPINLNTLVHIAETFNTNTITIDTLVQAGAVGKNDLVKILANGEIKNPINISAHAFSKKAKESIEKAGGTATIIA